MNLRNLLAALVPVTLVLIGITKPDYFSEDLQAILFQPVTARLSLLLGLSLLPVLVVLFVHDTRISRHDASARKARDERDQKLLIKEQEIDVLSRQLRDRDRLRFLDIVTGIPNQLKWQRDVADLSKRDDPEPRYQMIMIDLDNFREVNRKYGYEKGDEVIRRFAQSVFNSMRRNEEIYKNLMRNEDDQPVALEERWQRIYRKYTGGDEFIFVIAGDQAEAVGFLVRIVKDLLPKINDDIARFILEESPHLSFHAGMCEWIVGDAPQDVLRRLQECLRIATDSSTSRLHVHPPITAAEFDRRVQQATGRTPRWNPFREAERLFAIPPHGAA
jgi:GGDEF domain-containing protein